MCSSHRFLGEILCLIAASSGLIAVILAFLAMGSVAVAQPGAGFAGFEPPVFYPVGVAPNNVRAGDLDGDGFLDLVTANGASGVADDISILINNGDGTFKPEIRIPVANVPADVGIADFNGDGVMDIAVAFTSVPPGGNQAIGGVAILIATAPVQYQGPVFYAAGIQPVAMGMGDFDRDGDIDLVTVNQLSANVTILFNNGSGVFSPPASLPVGSLPGDVVVGDLDNDGDLDIVAVNGFFNDLSALINIGDGSFLKEKRFATGASVTRIALGDFNLDQRLDILIDDFSTVGVHLNLGGGTFGEATFFDVNGGVLDVEASRMDMGRAPDAVTGRGNISQQNPTPSKGAVLFGDGFGALEPSFDVDLGPSTVRAVLAVDLDNDGDTDYVGTRFSSIAVAINRTYLPGQADLTGDGAVNSADLMALLAAWGQGGAGDFDNSGAVDARDLAHLLANWTQPAFVAPKTLKGKSR